MQAELAVLRTYVENQAILEPILLYRVSKCKQPKIRQLWTFIRLLATFFLFSVKVQAKQDQTVL